ncbi:heterokaryon incompatibility protein-domain-containing protein [Xylariomycetidae sp. FL2044]|nr:heterokaryon incompatibility protein-domain-containing protein [Xylariomycetidae sp. FL2044]
MSKHQTAHTSYRPLVGSEIRLITLRPGLPEEPISCSLTYVSLESKPAFCALSYVWGDPAKTKDIELDGKPFPVTSNLHDALSRIRQTYMEELHWRVNKVATSSRYRLHHIGFWKWDAASLGRLSANPSNRASEATLSAKFFDRPLWIDALCINQQDDQERSEQVPRMGTIYRSALHTIAWLGNSKSAEEELWMHRMIDASYELATLVNLQEGPFVPYPATSDQDPEAVDMSYWMVQFLRLPWFHRIWIVQEVVLADSVILMINNRLALLRLLFYFQKAIVTPKNRGTLLPTYFMSLQHGDPVDTLTTLRDRIEERRAARDPERPTTLDSFAQDLLDTLLLAHRQKQASDPRDMIYGVLGLIRLPTTLPRDLVPDYGRPPATVFHNYFRFLLERTRDLRCLGWRINRIPGAPTWVPDLKLVPLQSEKRRASAPAAPVSFSPDGARLTVEGCRLGSCLATYTYDGTGPARGFDAMLLGFHDAIIARAARVRNNVPAARVESEWLAAIVHEGYFGSSPFTLEGVAVCYRLWTHERRDVLVPLLAGYLASSEARQTLVTATKLGFFAALARRAFFVTDRGAVGQLARSETVDVREGDVLCALRGWGEPCVLRPSAAGGGVFEFVNGCRVVVPSGDYQARLEEDEEEEEEEERWWDGRRMESLTLI